MERGRVKVPAQKYRGCILRTVVVGFAVTFSVRSTAGSQAYSTVHVTKGLESVGVKARKKTRHSDRGDVFRLQSEIRPPLDGASLLLCSQIGKASDFESEYCWFDPSQSNPKQKDPLCGLLLFVSTIEQ